MKTAGELSDTKSDGESWEDYAHRLERRIKQQRDQLRDVQAAMDKPERRARKRITALERALGIATLKLQRQHDGLRALNDKNRLLRGEGIGVRQALWLLASEPMESGREIGEIIETIRAQQAQGATTPDGGWADWLEIPE